MLNDGAPAPRQESDASKSSNETPAPSPRSLFFAVFPSIMLPMFLAVVDQTIVATALPNIAASLGDVERISWVVIAYLIAGTVAAPVYGYYGDLYGRRKVMFVALSVFIVASCLCAAAQSMLTLVLARIAQGLGGGGLMTLSQALIGETVPPRERARYQGYLAAVVVCSSTFGPVAGGLLTQSLGWRSVFFVNVPLGVIAIVLARRLPSKQAVRDRPRFDVVGLLLFVCFAVPLLIGLERLQAFDRSVFVVAAILGLAGVASLLLLLKQEGRTPNPLFPVSLLRRPEIWRADGMAALHGAALVSLITFLPLYLRVVHGTSATQTGLLLLPLTAGIGFGSMITGQIVSRTGRTMIVSTIGLTVVTLLLLVQAAFAVYMSALELTALWGVTALFMGSVMGVVQVTVQNAAGRERLGAAAASVQLSRSVGASFGTALIGMILFVTLAIIDPDGARVFITMIEQGASALDALPAARHAIVQADIAYAFRAAFLTIAAFTAGAGLLALTNPAKRLV
ncbi:MAG: MFS transporter [Methylobacteriaceae bacterium]|nr:MFS transporter [Methylobacteriaceae bacterium]